MSKKYKLSDEFIGRVINIFQEAMISGTDALDLFRQMEIQPDSTDKNVLVMTDDYRKVVDRWHKQIEDDLKEREKKATCIQGTGSLDQKKSGLYLAQSETSMFTKKDGN